MIASLPTFLGTCMSQRTPIRHVAQVSLFQPDGGTRFVYVLSFRFYVSLAFQRIPSEQQSKNNNNERQEQRITSDPMSIVLVLWLFCDSVPITSSFAHLHHKASLPKFSSQD